VEDGLALSWPLHLQVVNADCRGGKYLPCQQNGKLIARFPARLCLALFNYQSARGKETQSGKTFYVNRTRVDDADFK